MTEPERCFGHQGASRVSPRTKNEGLARTAARPSAGLTPASPPGQKPLGRAPVAVSWRAAFAVSLSTWCGTALSCSPKGEESALGRAPGAAGAGSSRRLATQTPAADGGLVRSLRRPCKFRRTRRSRGPFHCGAVFSHLRDLAALTVPAKAGSRAVSTRCGEGVQRPACKRAFGSPPGALAPLSCWQGTRPAHHRFTAGGARGESRKRSFGFGAGWVGRPHTLVGVGRLIGPARAMFWRPGLLTWHGGGAGDGVSKKGPWSFAATPPSAVWRHAGAGARDAPPPARRARKDSPYGPDGSLPAPPAMGCG